MSVSLRTIFFFLLGSLIGRGGWILLDYWRGQTSWRQARLRLEELATVLVGVALGLSFEAYLAQ
jgi:hypothetical protein